MSNNTIDFNSNLKEANYTLYKFPIGTVLTGLSKDVSIIHSVGNIVLPNTVNYAFIKNRDDVLIDLYSTGPDDYVLVDNITKNIYKENIANIVGIYVDANTNDEITIDYLNTKAKRIKESFGFYYYDDTGEDSVINGIKIKIKDYLCGVKHTIQLVKTEFGKAMFVIDNSKLYDADRFKSEFDNRTIPAVVRSCFSNDNRNSSLDSNIETIFRHQIIRLSTEFKHYMELIAFIVKTSYNNSLLKYYKVSMPTVDINNCTVTYHFGQEDIVFKVLKNRTKNRLTLVCLKEDNSKLTIIKDAPIDRFSKNFIEIMGLKDASELYKFSSTYISNLGCAVIKDYKLSSGDFNDTICAISAGNTSRVTIKNYIDTVYLYNLMDKCKLLEDVIMFRGRVNGRSKNKVSFRSLSFALPVALRHSRFDLNELGIVKCLRGSSMLVSNTDLIFSDELEAILNADYELKQISQNKFLTNKRYINITKINDILVEICESIISNNRLSHHLFINNVVNNTIKIEGYYNNFEINITVGKNGVSIKTDLSNRVFNTDDTLLTNINMFIWNYIKEKIYRGMQYSSNGKRTYRVLALNIQNMLTHFHIKHELIISNRDEARIKIGDNVISIYESTGIYVKHNNSYILAVQLAETTVLDMVNKVRDYILNNIDIDYNGYLQYLLDIMRGKEDYSIKDKNKDNLILSKTGDKHNICLCKRKNIIHIKGKPDKNIRLTFAVQNDAFNLYNLLNNGGK